MRGREGDMDIEEDINHAGGDEAGGGGGGLNGLSSGGPFKVGLG